MLPVKTTKIGFASSLTDTAPSFATRIERVGDDLKFYDVNNPSGVTLSNLLAVTTDEQIDDRIAALFVAGTGITLTYNDGAGTFTVTNSSPNAETTNASLLTTGTLDNARLSGVALTGSANTFTQIQQMTGLGLGTGTLNYLMRLHVAGLDGSQAAIQFTSNDTGTGATSGALVGLASDEALLIWHYEASKAIKFGTNNTERLSIGNTGLITASGQLLCSVAPAGTGVGQGSFYLNPSSTTANYTLLGVALGGTEKFRVDAEGDVTFSGTATGNGSGLTISGTNVTSGTVADARIATTIQRLAQGNQITQSGVTFYCKMQGNDAAGLPNVIDAVTPTVNGTPAAASFVTDSNGRTSIGPCLTLDGTDDYLNYGDRYDVASGNLTIACWFKTSLATSGQGIVEKLQVTGSNPGFMVRLANASNTNIYCYYAGVSGAMASNEITATASLRDGTWKHLVVVFDRTNTLCTAYVDGVAQGTLSMSAVAGSTDNTGNLYVGCAWNNSFPFNGQLDEVLMFNRALTANEVIRLYANGTIMLD